MSIKMLAELPFEILAQVVSYLPKAQQLYYLALACRRLHRFVSQEGWRVFVQERFPSIQTPPYWRDAAHALTTFSRNWDRRALIARYDKPGGDNLEGPARISNRRRPWPRPIGQTMGFQPALDSYEEWNGGGWSSRREVLAVGAGAELALRVKQTGPKALQRWKIASETNPRDASFDSHHNHVRWVTYKPSTAAQGIDDITSLKLYRLENDGVVGGDDEETVIVGRASGDLTVLTVPIVAFEGAAVPSRVYRTDNRPVKSLDYTKGSSPLLAACVSGTSIVLYPLQKPDHANDEEDCVCSIGEISAIPPAGVGPKQQAWTLSFLSNNRLATGIGPSNTPLNVYQISESGIPQEPLRRFHCRSPHHLDDGVDFRSRAPVTSAYQILPLTNFNNPGQGLGDVFLTGFHDGFITVNDMRSPQDYVQIYHDPIDQSAIYSLAAIGRERFVAGGARHSVIKFFDLRMNNGRAYYHHEQIPLPTQSPSQHHGGLARDSRPSSNAWNLYLVSTLSRREREERIRQPWSASRPERSRGSTTRYPTRETPIYALSSPSPCSPSLFAGVEDRFAQIDLVSIMDKHPDPLFEQGIERYGGAGDIDLQSTWDPDAVLDNFAMIEHNDYGGIGLMKQASTDETSNKQLWVEGYDERWRVTQNWKKRATPVPNVGL